ncbi:hypothetical protein RJ639_030984 [Escallonia herrerae]|uniref:non-specific serine/threonine protein kinase n=1 Tax=Escallonia herrerae TaxID=1293975 RepID=A0AA88WYE3_9ASTE|nr:hypothetical protein RJ639_030984 [Escallonia herrerae]
MDSQFFPSFPSFSLLFILNILILHQVPSCSSNPDEHYKNCGTAFSCGTITGIQYPFRGYGTPQYCGYPGLVLKCNKYNITTIEIMSMAYRVLGINQTTQVMKIAREDMMESVCPQELVNTTLDHTILDYASTNYMNVTFIFGCPFDFPGLNLLSCGDSANTGAYVLPGAEGPGFCKVSVVVPASGIQMGLGGSVNVTGLSRVLRNGFEVKWKVDGKACRDCIGSNGRCGYDITKHQTTCYCPDPTYTGLASCQEDIGAPSTLNSSAPTSFPGPSSGTLLFSGKYE